MKLFQYDDYLSFLTDNIKQNKHLRGFHARLSQAAGMHPSYLSRILHGSIHLTPDQAAGLCDFWAFTKDETTYFINLVHLARAGTPKLKRLLETDIDAMKRKHNELGDRLPAEPVEIQKENIYYSAWVYCAVHVLLTIPKFRKEPEISERLGLPRAQVKKILETLTEIGLVQKTKAGWEPTKANVHLSNKSWMAAIHHINWRLRMADRLQLREVEDLHYTGVHSLSRSDFKRIRELLMECLVNVDKVVRPSKEEDLYTLVIDWSPI